MYYTITTPVSYRAVYGRLLTWYLIISFCDGYFTCYRSTFCFCVIFVIFLTVFRLGNSESAKIRSFGQLWTHVVHETILFQPNGSLALYFLLERIFFFDLTWLPISISRSCKVITDKPISWCIFSISNFNLLKSIFCNLTYRIILRFDLPVGDSAR